MPRGDGTGPLGLGPLTGRRAGYCAGYPVPGFLNPFPRGGFARAWGRGFGFGRGMAWRRGFGAGHWAPYWVPFPGTWAYDPVNSKSEVEILKNQAKVLKEELEEIENRLKDLESSEKDDE